MHGERTCRVIGFSKCCCFFYQCFHEALKTSTGNEFLQPTSMFLQLSSIQHLWWFTIWFIYLPLLHIYTASRKRPRSSDCMLLVILQLSSQSTHKYVVVVEYPAATANTAHHRPFLCTQTVFCSTCAHLAQNRLFLDVCFATWCVFAVTAYSSLVCIS